MRIALWDTASKFLLPVSRNDVTDHLEDLNNKKNDYDSKDTDDNSEYGAAASAIPARLGGQYNTMKKKKNQNPFKANVFRVLALNIADKSYYLCIWVADYPNLPFHYSTFLPPFLVSVCLTVILLSETYNSKV